MNQFQGLNYFRYAVTGTNVNLLKTGRGYLHEITIHATRGQPITLYDGLDDTGTVILNLKANIAEKTYPINCQFGIGLVMKTLTNNDVTVVFS